tara:strand:- start:582 stop:917 length:336 start_codon:yes stop_codon:yes gene_type:complete
MSEKNKPIEEQDSKLAQALEEKNKFTEEELKKIKGFQSGYVETQVAFGQIAIGRLKLESQIEELKNLNEDTRKRFIKLQTDEQDFIKKITEKYGEGTLDPKTGIYQPSSDK